MKVGPSTSCYGNCSQTGQRFFFFTPVFKKKKNKTQHLKCEILIPNKLKEEFSHLHQHWYFQISIPAVPSKAAAAV